MVYGRSVNGDELTFEASGALLQASLVMRDRETDSWWSIMSSNAIGGPLEGHDLVELPVSEKMQWSDWVEMHPKTMVLSVDGVEHVDNNPYDNYFTSDETFRGLEIDDDRLGPKDPIYAFWYEGRPYAVAHATIEGGRVIELPAEDGSTELFFHRTPGSSLFASSVAVVVPEDASVKELSERIRRGELTGLERLGGFDTYWYSWIAVNRSAELLR